MAAPRLAVASLLALIALHCDITDVAEPADNSPDVDALGPIRVRGFFKTFRWTPIEVQEMLVAYREQQRGEENQEAETPPAISRIVAQTIVESDSPREADLVLADEPLVRVGMLDGPDQYLFSNIVGAASLPDGSVVVADEQSHEVRMFDAGGRHVWTSGREGQGPGEYRGLRLMRGCPGATATVFDWNQNRITRLGSDSGVVDTRVLDAVEVNPYNDPTCAPNGDLVFDEWPESEWDDAESVELGVCAAETSVPDVPQYVVGLRIPNYHILYLVVLKGGQIGSRAQAPRSLRRRKPQPLSLEVAKTFGRFAVDRRGGQWERRFVRTIRTRF